MKPLALSNLPVHYTGTNRSEGVPSVTRLPPTGILYHPVHWNKFICRQNKPKFKRKWVQNIVYFFSRMTDVDYSTLKTKLLVGKPEFVTSYTSSDMYEFHEHLNP
jgi:hypothetical protein